jgi:hypothetical protein
MGSSRFGGGSCLSGLVSPKLWNFGLAFVRPITAGPRLRVSPPEGFPGDARPGALLLKTRPGCFERGLIRHLKPAQYSPSPGSHHPRARSPAARSPGAGSPWGAQSRPDSGSCRRSIALELSHYLERNDSRSWPSASNQRPEQACRHSLIAFLLTACWSRRPIVACAHRERRSRTRRLRLAAKVAGGLCPALRSPPKFPQSLLIPRVSVAYIDQRASFPVAL